MSGSIITKDGVRAELPYNVKYGNGKNLLNALADLLLQKQYKVDLQIAGDPLARAVLAEGWYVNHKAFNTLKLLTENDLVYENLPKIEINMDEGVFNFHITSEDKDILTYIKKAWKILSSTNDLEFTGYNENMLTKDFISLSKRNENGDEFLIENSGAVDFSWAVNEIYFYHNFYNRPVYEIHFQDRYWQEQWLMQASGSTKRYAEILKNIFNNIKFTQTPYLFVNEKRALSPEILIQDEETQKFTGLTDIYREDDSMRIYMGEILYGNSSIYGQVPQNYVIPIYDNHIETLLKEIWYLIYYLENIARN